MSQRAVESVLGRLLTDFEFRARFFTDAHGACRSGEFILTERERSALLRLDLPALHDLAVRLDPTIVRAASVAAAKEPDDQTSFAFERRARARMSAPGARVREDTRG